MTAARARRPRAPLLLAAPALAVGAAVLLPLAYLIVRVVEGGSEAWALVDAGTTSRLVLDTLLLVAGVVAAAVLVAVPLAWLVVRSDMPGARTIGVAAALPLVIPSYVAALALLGAEPELRGYRGALLALTLSTYPYVYLLAAAALRNSDPALEEAARGLGHSPLRVFARVTLPTLRPPVVAGSLLVALYVISDFGAVSLMQYPTLTRSIYLRYEALFDRTAAAALALVLVALTAAVLVLEARARGSARIFRGGPGAARPARRLALGRWRWPALAFCVVVLAAFLALPLAVLGYWAAQLGSLGRPFVLEWGAAWNTLSASALAAVVSAVAVLPIALLAARHRRPWTRALQAAPYASNALPGIVVALALVFFAARYAGFVYQTLALLVFAYAVRFLPQALAATGSALEGINPRLEEAARGLGRGPFTSLVSVTLRLARPGLAAGAALVFLSAMKELPATLLLRPTGFDTLATEIWTATSLGAYADAAPSALLLVAIATPFVWALAARPSWELGAPG